MIVFFLLNTIFLSVAYWVAQHLKTGRDLIRQALLLVFAGGSFSLLTILILIFDFLEATQNELWRQFLADRELVANVSLLLFSDLVYGWIGIRLIRKKEFSLSPSRQI